MLHMARAHLSVRQEVPNHQIHIVCCGKLSNPPITNGIYPVRGILCGFPKQMHNYKRKQDIHANTAALHKQPKQETDNLLYAATHSTVA